MISNNINAQKNKDSLVAYNNAIIFNNQSYKSRFAQKKTLGIDIAVKVIISQCYNYKMSLRFQTSTFTDDYNNFNITKLLFY